MDDYSSMNVQRAAVQAMETVYIIATSKNLETIKSRFRFLFADYGGAVPSALNTLRKAQGDSEYSPCIRIAVDQFKTIHSGHMPESYQLAFIQDPAAFDLNEFYCRSLVDAMKRLCLEQTEEIRAFKKEAAKVKRIAKTVETIRSTIGELEERCASAPSYSTALAELQKLASTFGASE
jgi:hypothetical protein